VPGASQILFMKAVRDVGPSRAAILIGTAPLMSVLIALTILGEPFHPELAAGTVLVVAGGAALTRERIRPHAGAASCLAYVPPHRRSRLQASPSPSPTPLCSRRSTAGASASSRR